MHHWIRNFGKIFLVFIFNDSMCTSLVHHDIMAGFYQQHFINHAVILSCYSKNERVQLLKHVISNKNQMALAINIQKLPEYINILKIKHGRVGVVLDGHCRESKEALLFCGKNKFFDIKYYWLIFTNKNIENLFSEVDNNVDSNIFVIQHNRLLKNQYDIFEFYNPASLKGGNPVISKIGFFNNSNGYQVNGLDNKFFRRKDLRGVRFKTTLVLHEPYSGTPEQYLKNTDLKQYNTYNRYHAKLMKYCQEHYQYSMSIVNVTPLFGYQKPDGSMDGLVGDLERNIVDFGIAPLFVRKDRANVITYGRHTYTLRSSFVLLNPKSKAIFEIFLRPLCPNCWYCFLAFCILAIVIIKGMTLINIAGNFDSHWFHPVLCVIGIVAQQGSIVTPTTLSGKLGILFILNLSFFVYIFYSGSLVSFLLNVPLDLIDSVEDILNANFKVGIENIRFNKEYFKYTSDNVSLKLYKAAILGKEKRVYLNATKGLKQMKFGHYAFLVELAKAYPFLKENFKKELCQIKEVRLFKPTRCYANYVKHSSFRDIMDICLHRIAESGVMQKEIIFWHTNKPNCNYDFDVSTGIEETYVLLVCLSIGCTISMLLLCIEKWRAKLT